MNRNLDYQKIIVNIRETIKMYINSYKIKGLIMGVSGGADSGINSALLKPICDELGIPLIGRYIHIESNKQDEKDRAEAIGNQYCTEFKSIDLTDLYHSMLPTFEEGEEVDTTNFDERLRRGNIKCRLRMIYLYNLAKKYNALVVDNDNLTEHLLGFWTIGGDIGDITPLASLFKTEVYKLGIELLKETDDKKALQDVIDAIPTDGLGITSSDVEQLGVKNYDEADDILYHIIQGTFKEACEEHGNTHCLKVLQRNVNSEFKRNHPSRIDAINGGIKNATEILSIFKTTV